MRRLEHTAVIGQELALRFAEGEEVYLPLDLLRRACPCAACQGEPDALGRVLRPVQQIGPRGFELLRYEAVGGYALQLFWADGHSTGIYTFDYLLKLALLP
ncbi:gamma-butyrobetaine hydroxylase-like domain-containing protein [Luteolibacter sp. Populi]|uniref:gamma-butyrobetaine hydroxylase-like domain-containing protein n=1 Tax=Luteolibacter sp. Populi TaxID=3230487 RepID=UPI003467531E